MTNRLKTPKVFLIGETTLDREALAQYLDYVDASDFLTSYDEAIANGVKPAEALVSVAAKVCYKSLVVGQNPNVTRTRDIQDNLAGVLLQAHGSVLEHVSLNFIATDCSRVFTHELVRHRIASYSQTSGRYVAIDPGKMNLAWDPILDPVKDIFEDACRGIEDQVYLAQCRLGMRKPPQIPLVPPWFPGQIPAEACLEPDAMVYPKEDGETCNQAAWSYVKDALGLKTKEEAIEAMRWVHDNSFNFDKRKKLTSAIRRIAPNGQTNEIVFTLNVRSLRHAIAMRTARYAEYEIRVVFAQVWDLVKDRFKHLFGDAEVQEVDGLPEVRFHKMNPYDKRLEDYSDEELMAEVNRRVERDGVTILHAVQAFAELVRAESGPPKTDEPPKPELPYPLGTLAEYAKRSGDAGLSCDVLNCAAASFDLVAKVTFLADETDPAPKHIDKDAIRMEGLVPQYYLAKQLLIALPYKVGHEDSWILKACQDNGCTVSDYAVVKTRTVIRELYPKFFDWSLSTAWDHQP